MSFLDMIKPLKRIKTSQIKEEFETSPRDAWNKSNPSKICNYKKALRRMKRSLEFAFKEG